MLLISMKYRKSRKFMVTAYLLVHFLIGKEKGRLKPEVIPSPNPH